MSAIYRDSVRDVPSLVEPFNEGAAVARSMKSRLQKNLPGTSPTSVDIASAMGATVQRIETPTNYSGPSAYLIAEDNREFVVVLVADDLTNVDRAAAKGIPASQIESFLILHESAHTLFFDAESTSRKRLRSRSPAEEDFCDAFALELI